MEGGPVKLVRKLSSHLKGLQRTKGNTSMKGGVVDQVTRFQGKVKDPSTVTLSQESLSPTSERMALDCRRPLPRTTFFLHCLPRYLADCKGWMDGA